MCAVRGRSALDVRQASTARGHVAREVVVPQPSRDELGDAHNDPPLDRVTLAARQPDPAWTQQVPPGPDGRQRHLSAVWDMVLESRGVQGTLRISFPCPIVVRGGSNLPAGQERVGMFAYRLVSGHWRVQTGVARMGEAGTVTTAGVFGLNGLTGWEQRRPEWVDVAWLALRVHVGRQRKVGVVVDVIDVEEDEPPPTRKRKGRPEGDTGPTPPTPKAPRTATPAERAVRAEQAEPVGGRGQRGVVQEWVDQQRAGAWEARAISAEAANRDLEARLSRANEDRRDCESRLADVTKERDRLATKVRTLERDVATLRKAKPATQPAEAVERAEGAEAPAPPRVTWGGASAAGVRYLLAGAQAWHAQAKACAGQMSVVSTGLRMAMMASGKQVDVDSVAPDAPKVTAAMEEVRRQYPPPHRLTSAAMDPSFVEAVGEQSSRSTASQSSAPGGGGVRRYPPEHLSFPTTTNVILSPPPKHGQFDRYVGYSPPIVRNFLQHCLYINWGTVCPLTCLRFFLRNCLYFIWGMLCPLTCYAAG